MGRTSSRLANEAAEPAASFAALSRLLIYAKHEALALNRPVAASLIDKVIAALLERSSIEVAHPHGAREMGSASKH